jgi:PAS domain S-box-containing protein
MSKSKAFENWSITTKVVTSATLLVALAVAVSLVGLYGLKRMQEAVDTAGQASEVLVSVNTATEQVEHFIATHEQDSLAKAKAIMEETIDRLSSLALVRPDETAALTTNLREYSKAIDTLQQATKIMDAETSDMQAHHGRLQQVVTEIEADIGKRRNHLDQQAAAYDASMHNMREAYRILESVLHGERMATSIVGRLLAGDQTADPTEAENACKALPPIVDMLEGLIDTPEWPADLDRLKTSVRQAERAVTELRVAPLQQRQAFAREALQRLETIHQLVHTLEGRITAAEEQLSRKTDDFHTEAGLLQNAADISKRFAERVSKLEAQTLSFRLSPTDEAAEPVNLILDQLGRFARILPSSGAPQDSAAVLAVDEEIDGYRTAFDQIHQASKALRQAHDQVRQEETLTASLVTQFANEQRSVAAEHRDRGILVTALTSAIAAIIALVIAGLTSRIIAQPIVALAAVMRRLADGHLEDQIVGLERGDELGSMTRAVKVFQDNAIRVRALEAEAETERQRVLAQLENMVTERTRELRQANTKLQEEIVKQAQAEEEILRLNSELEQKVEERTRQIRRLVDSNIIGICFWGQDENIIEANDAFLNIVGYSLSDLEKGRIRWPVLSPPEYAQADEQFKKELAHSGSSRSYEKELIRKNGGRVPVLVGGALLSGETNQGVAFVLDQSERKRAEGELRRNQELLQSVLDNSTAVIYLKDTDGRFMLVNKRFTELFHISQQAVIGQTDHDLFPAERADAFHDFDLRVLAAGHPMETEELVPHDDGLHTYISLKYPLFNVNDQAYAICGISTDITERLQAKAEQQARQAAEAANRAKSEFLANMSHEIRTPMNAIKGLSYLLQQTELTTMQRDYVKKITSAQDSLLGLINDILDFSKIEAGKLSIESVPFNLEEVISEATGMLSQEAERKGLELVSGLAVDTPTRVVGDPLRLRQVLTNLLSNAIKFTEQGEVVLSIEWSADAERDGKTCATLQFSIRDTGIGLTSKQQEKLFQSFSQADVSTTRKYGGTGLGLAICKHLIELMGGEIGVESEYGKGSRFFFTLVLPIDASRPAGKFSAPPELNGLRILLADDNETSREILSAYLLSFGYRVDAVSSGDKALAMLKESTPEAPYDLAIFDWRMPEPDGLETARRIKSDPHLSGLPLIMISAHGREDIMREAIKVGVNSFLVKPINPSVLFDTILEALGRQTVRKVLAPEDSDEQAAKRQRIHSARVLVVDDNQMNRQISREILRTLGVNATTAASGQEALDLLGTEEFDVVLMDVQMPDMDGFQATRLIRSSTAIRPQLPIIALTAHALSGDREKCLEAGMNDYLTKPIDPGELLDVLARWIAPEADEAKGSSGPDTAAAPISADTSGPGMELPGIDTEDGLKRFSGDAGVYRQILMEFRDYCAGYSEPIAGALERNDLSETARLVHTIKGAAGTVGATSLFNAAVELEKGIMASDQKRIAILANTFNEELKRVLTSLARLGETAPPAPSGPGASSDASTARPILIELKNRMKKDLFIENELLEQLKAALPVQKESVAQLTHSIVAMEYQKGLEHLDRLLKLLAEGGVS